MDKEFTDSTISTAEDEQSHLRVLKHEFHSMDFNEKLKHWNACFEFRTNSLKQLCNTNKNLVDIWPYYKDPVGYRLVSINTRFFLCTNL